jgi:hypothetical protein
MTNQKLAAIAALPILLALSAAAAAQEESSVTPTLDPPPGVRDLPINPPAGAVVQSQGRFYIWGDAPFTKPLTPTDANGNNPVPGPQDPNTVIPATAPSTAVMRGAVGYVLPGGSYSDKLGSNARVEFGAASATASTNLTPTPSLANPQFLTGWTLGGCTNCNTLQSVDYEGRELSVKAATDYKADQLTLTPSVSVFQNRSHQDFVETNPGTATLDWKSTGAKVGLDSKVDLNKQLAVGVGGSYGLAQRDATLTGLDGASVNSGTVPHVGNAEAKITYKPLPEKSLTEFSLDTFAGVNNYDTKAPGLAAPLPGATPSVKFSPSSDFYAGAGATYKFGTQ